MVNSLQDTTTLRNGVSMPWFGLGVFKVEEGPELENKAASGGSLSKSLFPVW